MKMTSIVSEFLEVHEIPKYEPKSPGLKALLKEYSKVYNKFKKTNESAHKHRAKKIKDENDRHAKRIEWINQEYDKKIDPYKEEIKEAGRLRKAIIETAKLIEPESVETLFPDYKEEDQNTITLTAKEKIKNTILESDRPLRFTEIATRSGVPLSYTAHILKDLSDKKEIDKVRRGEYIPYG